MPIGTIKLPMVGGGYDAITDPLALELAMAKTGEVKSPDCLNMIGFGESVETRRGCQPWWDTGLTGKVYFVSGFNPVTLGGSGVVVIGGGGPTYPTTSTSTGGQPGGGTRHPTPQSSFNLTAPANAATGVSLTPTLTWSAARGAHHYDVVVATDAAFAHIVTGATVLAPVTSYAVPANALTNATVYYWRVTAASTVGGAAVPALNNPFHFTTIGATPLCPVAGLRGPLVSVFPPSWRSYSADPANAFRGTARECFNDRVCATGNVGAPDSPLVTDRCCVAYWGGSVYTMELDVFYNKMTNRWSVVVSYVSGSNANDRAILGVAINAPLNQNAAHQIVGTVIVLDPIAPYAPVATLVFDGSAP